MNPSFPLNRETLPSNDYSSYQETQSSFWNHFMDQEVDWQSTDQTNQKILRLRGESKEQLIYPFDKNNCNNIDCVGFDAKPIELSPFASSQLEDIQIVRGIKLQKAFSEDVNQQRIGSEKDRSLTVDSSASSSKNSKSKSSIYPTPQKNNSNLKFKKIPTSEIQQTNLQPSSQNFEPSEQEKVRRASISSMLQRKGSFSHFVSQSKEPSLEEINKKVGQTTTDFKALLKRVNLKKYVDEEIHAFKKLHQTSDNSPIYNFIMPNLLKRINTSYAFLEGVNYRLVQLKLQLLSDPNKDSEFQLDRSIVIDHLKGVLSLINSKATLDSCIECIRSHDNPKVTNYLIKAIGLEEWHTLQKWRDIAKAEIYALLKAPGHHQKHLSMYDKSSKSIQGSEERLSCAINEIRTERHPELLKALSKKIEKMKRQEESYDLSQLSIQSRVLLVKELRALLAKAITKEDYLTFSTEYIIKSIGESYKSKFLYHIGLLKAVVDALQELYHLYIEECSHHKKISGADAFSIQLTQCITIASSGLVNWTKLGIADSRQLEAFVSMLNGWDVNLGQNIIINFIGRNTYQALQDWMSLARKEFETHLFEEFLLESQRSLLPHYYSIKWIEDRGLASSFVAKRKSIDIRRTLFLEAKRVNFKSISLERLNSIEDTDGKPEETYRAKLNDKFDDEESFWKTFFYALADCGWVFSVTNPEEEMQKQIQAIMNNQETHLPVMELLYGLSIFYAGRGILDEEGKHYHETLYNQDTYWTKMKPETDENFNPKGPRIDVVIQVHSPNYFRVIRKWTDVHYLIDSKHTRNLDSYGLKEDIVNFKGKSWPFAQVDKVYTLTWDPLGPENSQSFKGELKLSQFNLYPETPYENTKEVLDIYWERSKESYASLPKWDTSNIDPLLETIFFKRQDWLIKPNDHTQPHPYD